jgi:broad specificity phosphatase PhoE
MSPEPRALELVLVRHAESLWNAEDRWQGQTDVPLSARGEGEAARVGARLAREPFDAIVSSDLSRARSTAEAIVAARRAAGLPSELVTHAGLREMDLGAWCGLPHAEVMSRFPAEVDALARGDDLPIGGHGESLPGFEARVHAALGEVLSQHRADRAKHVRLLVVTHGGCIRAVLMRLLSLRGRRRPLEGAGNTSLTTLRVMDGAVRSLVSYNDASHLAASTRAHDGAPEASTDRETLLGARGRARVLELFGLTDATVIEPPPDDATTELVPASQRLVRYAIR